MTKKGKSSKAVRQGDGAMYRATTPLHTYKLPIQTDTCDVILVTYKQDETVVTKRYENGSLPDGMSLDGDKVIIKLTQEETLKFTENGPVSAQIRVLTENGDAFASRKFKLSVFDVHNEEILT